MKWVLLASLLGVGAWAQSSALASPHRLTLASTHLSEPLQAEVHLPGDYSVSPTRRYPLCLLLHGAGSSAADLRSLGLAELATQYQIIIVAPDAGRSLFVDSIGAGDHLESALLQDLLPELDRRFRTQGTRQGRMLAGLSFGGFAALHLGMLHPERFALVASLSGVVGAPRWSAAEEALLPPEMRLQMRMAFGLPGSVTRSQKDLFAGISTLSPKARKALPFLALECGTEDIFLPANRRFANLLESQSIPHEFSATHGKHDGEFWGRRLDEVLRLRAHRSELATTPE